MECHSLKTRQQGKAEDKREVVLADGKPVLRDLAIMDEQTKECQKKWQMDSTPGRSCVKLTSHSTIGISASDSQIKQLPLHPARRRNDF